MKRRTFLATCGSAAAVAVAGCSGGGDGSDGGETDDPTRTATNTPTETDRSTPTETQTETPTGTVEPTPTYQPSVSLGSLQPGVLILRTDAIGVRDRAGQYLYLDVSIEEGDPPAKDEFAFQFGGDSYAPFTERTPVLWRDYNHDGAYSKDRGEGWLLFELPATGDAADAGLTWGFGNEEWRPDGTVRERLAAFPPEFSASVSVPEAVPEGEKPTVSITATNEGDVPGHFVAGLNRSGPRVAIRPVKAASFRVPAGESKTWEHTDDTVSYRSSEEFGDGEADMTYRVNLNGTDRSRDVRITKS